MARNFCLLILLSVTLWAKEDFWFSYKIATQNSIMIYEERNISPVMSYEEENESQFLCQISSKTKQNLTTYQFLLQNYESLLECFYKADSRVISHSQIELKAQRNQNELTILPTKFTVDFKDEFANIYLLKEM